MFKTSGWVEQPFGFGTIATVLGSIGLALFPLPILSIPIATFGLLAGIVGMVHTMRWPSSKLRWSVVGCALCVCAISLGLVLAYTPINNVPAPSAVSPFWEPPGRPYVSPPARLTVFDRPINPHENGEKASHSMK
jgi:hypothetical protein